LELIVIVVIAYYHQFHFKLLGSIECVLVVATLPTCTTYQTPLIPQLRVYLYPMNRL